jgi:hypothetical protein
MKPLPHWYDYDGTLQMIRQPKREPDMKHLTYLRWLLLRREAWVMDGEVLGAPSGPLAPTPEKVA